MTASLTARLIALLTAHLFAPTAPLPEDARIWISKRIFFFFAPLEKVSCTCFGHSPLFPCPCHRKSNLATSETDTFSPLRLCHNPRPRSTIRRLPLPVVFKFAMDKEISTVAHLFVTLSFSIGSGRVSVFPGGPVSHNHSTRSEYASWCNPACRRS